MKQRENARKEMTEQLRQWEDTDYREGVLRTAADSEIWADAAGRRRRSTSGRAVEVALAIAEEEGAARKQLALVWLQHPWPGRSDRTARGWIIRTRSSPNGHGCA